MSTIEKFLRYLGAQLGHTDNTVLAYGGALSDFENWLGGTGLKASRQQIYEYLADCSERGLSPVTVAHRLSVLRHFYSFAMDEGVVNEDPTYNVKGPKLQQKLPAGALSVNDVSKMLKVAATEPQGLRDQVIILLGFDAGLRESEMATLALDAVQLKDGLIRIRHGKGDKNATLPILPVLARALRRYLKDGRPQLLRNRECPYLLVDRNGTAMSRQAIWQRIRALSVGALGQPRSPHKLRAGFCTALNDGGMDVRSVQSLMRHADLSTTQRYINLDVKQLRRAYYKSFPRAKR